MGSSSATKMRRNHPPPPFSIKTRSPYGVGICYSKLGGTSTYLGTYVGTMYRYIDQQDPPISDDQLPASGSCSLLVQCIYTYSKKYGRESIVD